MTKLEKKTMVDLNLAIGLVRVEDRLLNSILMRAWNRLAAAGAVPHRMKASVRDLCDPAFTLPDPDHE